MPLTREDIDKLSEKEAKEKLLKVSGNTLYDSYFTWSRALEVSNKGIAVMTDQMEELAEKGQIDDEYIKLQKEIADAGKRSLELQTILNNMKSSFDPEELLKEEQRRLAAKEGSIEEYAAKRESYRRSRVQKAM